MSPALDVTALHFAWPRQPPLLRIDQLRVERGERVLLRGPSGSGKSTLLALLGGVLTPQQGQVELLGEPFSALGSAARDRKRAKHIGFVFQQFNLLPYLSVRDNVALGVRFAAERRARVPNLQGEIQRLLDRLEVSGADRDRPVAELSIGQQQRVACARALLGAPELVIADEPTSSLDHDRRERFLALLSDELTHSGGSLLFVSHDPTLAAHFSRTLELVELNQVATR